MEDGTNFLSFVAGMDFGYVASRRLHFPGIHFCRIFVRLSRRIAMFEVGDVRKIIVRTYRTSRCLERQKDILIRIFVLF